LRRVTLGTGALTTLATGQASFNAVRTATTSSYVFWATANGLYRCDKTVCAPSVLATGAAYDVVVDGSVVYWSDSSGIRSCPAAGCAGSPATVVSAFGVRTMRQDATSIYYLESFDRLYRVTK
jgi:hypothetical protein